MNEWQRVAFSHDSEKANFFSGENKCEREDRALDNKGTTKTTTKKRRTAASKEKEAAKARAKGEALA